VRDLSIGASTVRLPDAELDPTEAVTFTDVF
jgi:hypothetical protein